ncbi:hypothetical protein A5784_20990 [Mycobacterium sp. 852013-50091_SCH5140682]|uniref:hypothetical protein n=1 Tax=Mycobacterium sp. 852013-50091_SCH5140682 TaxID=1834109 RepID=UPI0007E99DF5|nr:hypothetical protein [Mycobacterium sp. 852013-50091_SCH5140682]OBC00017.1 hypothetical protein A5784_20990 [Mycobacterium sp. 852013-50091_SCH5140682]
MFAITSRYQGIPTSVYELPDGRKVTYVRRRFLPRPADLTQIGTHEVRVGERLDTVAFAVFGDPEQFWMIADGNPTLDLTDLTAVGVRLRITLAGIPQGGLLQAAGVTP